MISLIFFILGFVLAIVVGLIAIRVINSIRNID